MRQGDERPAGEAAKPSSSEDWHRLVAELDLGGVASQLAQNCELVGWNSGKLCLTLDPECGNLRVPLAEERLRSALAAVLGQGLEIEIRISRPESETPARRQIRHRAERQAEAQTLMEQDPVALALEEQLDARWVPESIEPAE